MAVKQLPGLTRGQSEFAYYVAAHSDLSIPVLVAWIRAEGGADDNPLNIRRPDGSFTGFGSPAAAGKATIDFLKGSYYDGIRAAAKTGNDAKVIAAIGASPWGTIGSILTQIFSEVSGDKSLGKISPAAGRGGGATTSTGSSEELFGPEQRSGALKALLWVAFAFGGASLAFGGLSRILGLKAGPGDLVGAAALATPAGRGAKVAGAAKGAKSGV